MTLTQQILENINHPEQKLYAALDIGSNSFHLVIARDVENDLQVVNKVKQKVRLADGLDRNNYLSEEAMERGLDTLRLMLEYLVNVPNASVRVVATHTLRRAVNALDFLERAKEAFPYPIEIISGAEEARLIYIGVANSMHWDTSHLVIDIGGGSTEFALGHGDEPLMCKSVQMGCVSYRKRFFADGKLNKKNFKRAITSAQQEIELVVSNLKRHDWQSTVGTSGTIRAVASVAAALNKMAVVEVVTKRDLYDIMDICIECGSEDKLHLEGLSEERRPVFAGGVSILIGLFESLKLDNLQYNPSALREGVLFELQSSDSVQSVRERTAYSMLKRYDVDTEYADLVVNSCTTIFDEIAASWFIDNRDNLQLLCWAAMLHEVGLQINSRGVQRHSSYIIENSEMAGFNQEQQLLIATLVRFHRKKIKRSEFPKLNNYPINLLEKLLIILRLSVLINVNRNEPALTSFTLACFGRTMRILIREGEAQTTPLLLADLQTEADMLATIDYQMEVELTEAN